MRNVLHNNALHDLGNKMQIELGFSFATVGKTSLAPASYCEGLDGGGAEFTQICH